VQLKYVKRSKDTVCYGYRVQKVGRSLLIVCRYYVWYATVSDHWDRTEPAVASGPMVRSEAILKLDRNPTFYAF